jgi:hypothetical protein
MMRNFLVLASSLLPVLVTTSGIALASPTAGSTFDPLAFQKQWRQVSCPAINHAENKTVDLQLRMLHRSYAHPASTLTYILARQTISISTRARTEPSCSCMVGRVCGQAGNIRSKNSACVVQARDLTFWAIFSRGFAGRLPFDRPQYSGFWSINTSGGCPILWLNPRCGWGHDVHLRTCRCFPSRRDRVSHLF